MRENRLLKPEEAADLLKVSRSTLAHWRTAKKKPRYVRINRNVIRYLKEDIARFERRSAGM